MISVAGGGGGGVVMVEGATGMEQRSWRLTRTSNKASKFTCRHIRDVKGGRARHRRIIITKKKKIRVSRYPLFPLAALNRLYLAAVAAAGVFNEKHLAGISPQLQENSKT